MTEDTTGEEQIQAVRAFNDFYKHVIKDLHQGPRDTPYPHTTTQVIFELSRRETTEVAVLRRILGIDAGYLSRVLARLEFDGLATRERSMVDGRCQAVRLTRQGREAFASLHAHSTDQIRAWLSRYRAEEQRRLVAAMRTIREILEDTPRPSAFALRSPNPGDLGWVVHRHGLLYADEYGWNQEFEAFVARLVADYVSHRNPAQENAWIADVNGQIVGCVFCKKREEKVAQLCLLLVEPIARKVGIGSRLVEECMRFARRAGYERIMLCTSDVLVQARRLFERKGFKLVDEERCFRFGHDLVEQNWWRTLAGREDQTVSRPKQSPVVDLALV